MPNQRSAPIYLNLFRIRFPVGAVTSIAHRVSGVLLFLCFPLLVYLLDLSLQGPDGFAIAVTWLQSFWIRLASIAVAWSVIHHLFSGIRFLAIDTGVGVHLESARITAWGVNIAALLLTFIYSWWIF